MRTTLALLVGIAVSTLSAPAHADAWAAAQKVIPGGMTLIVGVDVTAVRGTPAEAGVKKFLEESYGWVMRDAPQACGIDPWERLRSFVAVTDEREAGAMFFELADVTADDLIACLQKGITEDDITIARDGNLIVATDDGRAELTLGWVDGVVVVATRNYEVQFERAQRMIPRMIGGRGVAGDAILIRALRDVRTSAPIWMISGDRHYWDTRDGEIDRFRGDESDEEASRPLMRYAVAELALGATPTITAKGRFLSGADQVNAMLERELRGKAEDEIGRLEILNTGDMVQLTATLSSTQLGQVITELARMLH